MFELVEIIAIFLGRLAIIAMSIMVLYHFADFVSALYRKEKPRKPKITRKFSIPKNQNIRAGKSFKSSKSIRRG